MTQATETQTERSQLQRMAQIVASLNSLAGDRTEEQWSQFWTFCATGSMLTALLTLTVPPINSAARWLWLLGDPPAPLEKLDRATQYLFPDMDGTPTDKEWFAEWQVTSPYDLERVHPVHQRVQPHYGVDLVRLNPEGKDITKGSQLFAIGEPGDTTTVTCWDDPNGGGLVAEMTAPSYPGLVVKFLHLSKCQAGSLPAGSVAALAGDSGIGTGAHLDVRMQRNGEWVPPERWVVWQAIGKTPPKGEQGNERE